jgi:hypothetical protein
MHARERWLWRGPAEVHVDGARLAGYPVAALVGDLPDPTPPQCHR